MNLLDFILVVIVVIGFILGYKDGFVRKIIGLIGLIAGLYLAVFFAGRLGGLIENAFGLEGYFANIVAGISIFLAIILIFAILKRVIHPFDKVNNFTNQLVGGFIGALQILFFASAVLYLINIFGIPKKEIKETSLLYYKVYYLIPNTVDFVSSYTPNDQSFVRYKINNSPDSSK